MKDLVTVKDITMAKRFGQESDHLACFGILDQIKTP